MHSPNLATRAMTMEPRSHKHYRQTLFPWPRNLNAMIRYVDLLPCITQVIKSLRLFTLLCFFFPM